MEFIRGLIGLYIILSVLAVGVGFITKISDESHMCHVKKVRLVKAFPSFDLGCWLGEVSK